MTRILTALTSLTIAATLALVGCTSPAEEAGSDAAVPAPVEMTGKPDPSLAGKWVTDNGNSTYQLEPNGSYHLDSKVTTNGNSFMTHSDGTWAVDGNKLFVKGPSGTVAAYTFERKDNQLTLTATGSVPTKTVLNRR